MHGSLIALGLFESSIGHQPPPVDPPPAVVWNILDPENWDPLGGNSDMFPGDVPCAGSAGRSNYAFILKLKNNASGSLLASYTGSSVTDSWSGTVSEPSEGWSAGLATLSLRVDGVTQATKIIKLKD